jgi:hypothetical protein
VPMHRIVEERRHGLAKPAQGDRDGGEDSGAQHTREKKDRNLA